MLNLTNNKRTDFLIEVGKNERKREKLEEFLYGTIEKNMRMINSKLMELTGHYYKGEYCDLEESKVVSDALVAFRLARNNDT